MIEERSALPNGQIILVRWPPHNAIPEKWDDDPLDQWHPEMQSATCPQCDFVVEWIIRANRYEADNENFRAEVIDKLSSQHDADPDTTHPWPNLRLA